MGRFSLRRILEFREFFILVVVLLGGAVMAVATPGFLSRDNLVAIVLGQAVEVILACGMTVLMVSGAFDMSVGSTAALAGVAVGLGLRAGFPVGMAVFLGLLSGAIVGLVNGVFVAKVKINPFIVTLATLAMVRSLVLVLCKGVGISGLPDGFTRFGQGYLLGIQGPIWAMLVFVVIFDILLRKSRYFRQNYYLGGNERSAVLSGINVQKTRIVNFVLMGILAAVGGMFLTARLGTASTTAGQGIELRVISAVIIGGASLSGGEGTVIGAMLGALLMGLINNALNLLGVDVYWQQFVIGGVLLLAVIIDTFGKNRREQGARMERARAKQLDGGAELNA